MRLDLWQVGLLVPGSWSARHDIAVSVRVGVVVSARNEADRLPATIAALRGALGDVPIVVADDHSTDGTAAAAITGGAEVVRADRHLGKGGVTTLAARALLERHDPPAVLLCDGDLGSSAAELAALLPILDHADLVVAAFERRAGGGFGIALGFARWAVRDLTGQELAAPISGQRALRAPTLQALLPFASGFGMEIGMTVDAVRAGARLAEHELPLEHRARGRSAAGFLHRARQLAGFVRVYLSRRVTSGRAPG